MTEIAQPSSAPQRIETVDLDDVSRDYRVLDRVEMAFPKSLRLLSHHEFSSSDDGINVEYVAGGSVIALAGVMPVLHDLLYAFHVLRRADKNSAIICNGGCRVGKLIGLFNYLLPIRRRKILMWELFCEARSPFRYRLIRWMVQGCDLVVVYSRHQVKSHAEYLRLPEDTFLFLPYKANHSKQPPIEMPIGNYVFSGGNSKRDYCTLFEAVRGTGIPLIVSATDPRVTAGLQVPSNVILLKAVEPAFARLTAGSRFAVVPIVKNIIRSAGEANVCNAMWHGKPVIVADDVSLGDYVEDGVTGYTVAAGDVEMLRQRIVSLWTDADLVREMGRRAHQRVAESLTHVDFVRRQPYSLASAGSVM